MWACDRVIVHAYDDARVWASGTCVVYARENTAVWAGSMATVYKETRFGPFRGSVQGGRVVVKRDADEMAGEQWCRAALVHVDEDGMAHLFKATDRDGVSHRGGVYRVGEVVDDSANWKGDRFFGGGLHVSPSPGMALARSRLDERKGVRFFEVTCPVSELVSLADDVCKAPRLRVVREVDAFGEARKRRQRVVVTVTDEDMLWDVDALSAEGIVSGVTVGRGVLTIFMLGAPDGDGAHPTVCFEFPMSVVRGFSVGERPMLRHVDWREDGGFAYALRFTGGQR